MGGNRWGLGASGAYWVLPGCSLTHWCLLHRDIGKRLEVRKTVTACLGEPNHITRLEHVQARLTLSYNRRGDLAIHLISPMGTRSTLLAARCSPCSLLISWFIPSFVPKALATIGNSVGRASYVLWDHLITGILA